MRGRRAAGGGPSGGAHPAETSHGLRANPHLAAANFTSPVSLSPVSQRLHTLKISPSKCFQTGVMTNVARGRTETAAEGGGGHSLGAGLRAFPEDKASKYGCVHKS